MKCPKCESENIDVQIVTENTQRGCLNVLLWIILAVLTCGIIILFIPIIRGRKSKSKKIAICQNCGYEGSVWEFNIDRWIEAEPKIKSDSQNNISIIRAKSVSAMALKMKVAIDGQEMFSLKNGEEKRLKLTNEIHNITFSMKGAKPVSVEVDLRNEDTKLQVECEYYIKLKVKVK